LLAWRSSWSTVRQFIDTGVGDFLRMPASQGELLLRVVLRAGAADLGPRVDRDALAVPAGVRLSPREQRLYELLAARAGSAVTRDEIRAHVWGSDHTKLSSNIVEVYVRYVRTKLASAASGVMIRTVPRVGYALETARVTVSSE
jgi:DNA-binding response OmpR family regulator